MDSRSLISEALASIELEVLTECYESDERRHHHSSNPERGNRFKSTLFGRVSETTLLLRSFSGVCGPNSERKVVSVHGVSGVGKTALIRGALRDVVALQGKGFFVEGKFDQVVSKAPFNGVVEALSDLCDVIEQSEEFEMVHRPRIRRKLEGSTPQTISILSRLFPVHQLLGTAIEETIASDYIPSPEFGSRRVVSEAFRVLVQALASPTRPCVIFLDDVQWANQGSIDVIEALATDPEPSNVLYVLAGRDDDADEQTYRNLVDRISSALPVTDMQVGPLDSGSIHQMVCWTIELPPSASTRALTDVVVEKTLANPLQVNQYLRFLHSVGLLQLNSQATWTFDVEKIKNETNVSDSVAAQVRDRLSLLDAQSTMIMCVAAFLGFNFEVDTLAKVFDYTTKQKAENMAVAHSRHLDEIENSTAVACAVRTCCRQHLVEPMLGKTGWYKFSHDSIQRSLYDAHPDGYDSAMMHYHIGTCLNELKSNIPVFDVADHLNRALSLVGDNEDALCELAKMNLEAAGLSLESLDFSSSYHYGNLALECLRLSNIEWSATEELRLLNLRVYELLAKTSLQLGNFDRCHQLCSAIRSNSRCLSETKDALITRCCAFRAQNRPKELINFAVVALSDMSVNIPKSPSTIQLLRRLIRVRRLLRSRFGRDAGSRYDILEWPESKDDRDSCIASILSYCGLVAHYIGEKKNFAVYAFLYIVQQAVLKEVFFADSSPFAFCLYGYVELMLGKEEVAYKYGELVLQMLKRPVADEEKNRSLFSATCYLLRSKRLLSESVEPCFASYEMALATGNVERASLMLKAYIFFAMNTDQNLLELHETVRRSCRRLKQEYKQENFFQWVSLLWQALRCMIGESESPTILTGEVTVEEEALAMAKQSNNNGLLSTFYSVKLDLVVLFGATTSLAETIVTDYCRGATALNVVHFSTRMAYFSAALAHVDFLQAGLDKRPLASFFRKSLKLFRSWKSRGLVNEIPFCLVLEAEEASLSLLPSKKSRRSSDVSLNRVLRLYEDGIAAARAAGFRRLEAQATERAGRVLIDADRLCEAKEYMDKASDLFSEWGAVAKVEHMQPQYGCLERTPSIPLRVKAKT